MKEEQEISKNFSSGAEKVETIAQANVVTGLDGVPVGSGFEQIPTATVPATFGVGTPIGEEKKDKGEEQVLLERASKRELYKERERARAQERIKRAQLKKERKENAKNSRKKMQPKNGNDSNGNGGKDSDNDKNHRRRKNDYGGWIAAVVALGVTTLTLGAVVTAGAIDMKETKQGITNAYRGNLYELTSLIENVDGDLDRVRVSASPAQQQRILTDLLVQARLAESVIEKLPIDAQNNGNVTSFINRTAFVCEHLLSKLRKGETLDEKDQEVLEKLYETNHRVRGMMEDFIADLQDEDLTEYLKGKGEDKFSQAIQNVENATMEENRNPTFSEPPEVRAGATPKDSQDEKISSAKAEELCRGYFSEYDVQKIRFDGETVSRKFQAYNFVLTDSNDVEIFAQISEMDGSLISFDYYEYCTKQNLDIENAKTVALNFLEKMGMENMTAVKVSQTGATASFTFCYELDGDLFYPDSVNVKVCEEKGVVVGYNASAYLRHHKERTPLKPTVSMTSAKEKLHDKLTLEGSKVALINVKGRERVAYEFICSYNDETYFVYIDGNTGEEISILNAKTIMR
ncbi:MAG: hypothetical protein E7343_04005 [Clostridiales bacterium]|nr:hypothetical protein [Clostridiales bacterium]